MNKLVTPISIAKDFAKSTGGRVPAEGPFSGQEFRDTILVKELKAGNKKIIIDRIFSIQDRLLSLFNNNSDVIYDITNFVHTI